MLLTTYLKKNGLTDTAFAGLVGVGQATISRYHRGRFPSIEQIIKIEEVTGGAVKANDHVKAYCKFHGIGSDAG